ncbi:hypothetical protein B0H14DRAFT_3530694 [Mycena olivaceomarginata]|nr:hypothetical protein B0H14DRAFT_3530694 [Mycena olivaceomarginata]
MPNGSIVADIDTGTPTTIFPPDILYSHIPGAIVGVVGGDMSLFIFCNISGIVTAVIGFVPASLILPALNHMLNGRGYPIHPLDLSQVELFDVDDNGNNFTACRATMVDLGAGSANDAVFGDSFMRNEYSVFKFGNNVAKSPTGAASIQFLSIFDPSMAAQDVQNARMVRLASLPPEADFDLKGALPATPRSTRPTSDTLHPDPTELPTSSIVPTSTQVATTAALEAIGPVSGDASVEKYAPIIIGLLGRNLLLVLLLLIIGVVVYIQQTLWSPKTLTFRVLGPENPVSGTFTLRNNSGSSDFRDLLRHSHRIVALMKSPLLASRCMVRYTGDEATDVVNIDHFQRRKHPITQPMGREEAGW